MKIYCFLEKTLLKLITFIWKCFIYIHEIKNITKKRPLYKNIKLTKEQKQQIDDYYKKNYGKKISYNWHRLYQSYTGNFDYKYVPEYLFTTKLELLSNKRTDILPLENKVLLETFFSNLDNNITIPKTYVEKIQGIYFDESKNIISKKEAIDIINKKYKNCVIKISKDSNSGRGVKILNIENGIDKKTKLSTKKIFEIMGNDFIIQEKINQHSSISKIYPHSINTFRVITYLLPSGCYATPIVLRIGQGGNEVDNAHSGGMFIAVSEEGKLPDFAFTEYQTKYTEHPDTKLKFKDYQIPLATQIKDTVIKLHKQLPTVKLISWDIAFNNLGQLTIIEVNLHSQAIWILQMAHGKGTFGEHTDEILKEIKKGR